MATIRLSSKQIKSVNAEDKKTWPVDLQVWVEISTEKPWKEWDAPFYLLPDQMKAFKKVILEGVKKREERIRSIRRR